MDYRRITLLALIAFLLLMQACSSGVVVRRADPMLAHPVRNVAVLLFYQEVDGAPLHLAELATDAFTFEVAKYFPVLVDRYKVRDFLRRNKYKHALSPRVLHELGQELEVDALFVGKITGYSETESFFGWKGKPHFKMGCRLLSVKTGRSLLDGQADMEGSYVVPVETHKDRVVFGVRMLTKKMGLAERFGPVYVTRDDPLWIHAMAQYEKKRFWDAAHNFGLIVHYFGESDLRDEAQFYLARSLEELRLRRAALKVYDGLVGGPFASRALLRRMEIAFHQGSHGEVIQLASRIKERWAGGSEIGAADYLAGLSLLQTGKQDEGIVRLKQVSEASRWYGFAQYALGEPYFETGDSAAAQQSLIAAARSHALTESERRLCGKALIALGDFHYHRGDLAGAAGWYEKVEGYFLPRARLGLAWVAAERGDYEGAIAHVDAIGGDAPPRWSGEAELLAGTCEARLARLDRSAARLETALGKCAEWKTKSEEGQEILTEFTNLCEQVESTMGPMEPEIVALLLGDQGEVETERLTTIRRNHEEVTRTLASLERRVGSSMKEENEELLRRRIMEKAEFSLVQVRFEKERDEQAATRGEGGGQ